MIRIAKTTAVSDNLIMPSFSALKDLLEKPKTSGKKDSIVESAYESWFKIQIDWRVLGVLPPLATQNETRLWSWIAPSALIEKELANLRAVVRKRVRSVCFTLRHRSMASISEWILRRRITACSTAFSKTSRLSLSEITGDLPNCSHFESLRNV